MLRRPKSTLNVSKCQNRKIIFPNSDFPSYTSPSSNSNLFALSYRRTNQKVVNDVRNSREFTFYYVMKSVKNCLHVKLFQRNFFCFSTPKSSACVFRYTLTRFYLICMTMARWVGQDWLLFWGNCRFIFNQLSGKRIYQ